MIYKTRLIISHVNDDVKSLLQHNKITKLQSNTILNLSSIIVLRFSEFEMRYSGTLNFSNN